MRGSPTRAACFDRGVSSGSGRPFTVTFGDGCALTDQRPRPRSWPPLARSRTNNGVGAEPGPTMSARPRGHRARLSPPPRASPAPWGPVTRTLRAHVTPTASCSTPPRARSPDGVPPRDERHIPRASATPRAGCRARRSSRRLTRRRIEHRVSRRAHAPDRSRPCARRQKTKSGNR